MSVDLTDRVNEAITTANRAHDRVDSHEEICAVRYENLYHSISRIENILKWAGSLIFSILLAVLGWLIVAQIHGNDSDKDLLQKQIEALRLNQVQPNQP